MSMHSQTVLITGCSSGFGELMSKTLAKAGHHVFASMRGVASRNAKAASELRSWAEREGVRIDVVDMDVTSAESVQAAVEGILTSADTIDVVVNNAGGAALGPFEAFSMRQIESLFSLNVLGPMRVNKAVLPSMRRNRSGLIIHISSTMGRVLPGFGGLYPATKWALEGLAESLSYEVRAFGIDAVIVEPGAFPSPAMGNAMVAEDSDVTRAYDAPSAISNTPEADADYHPPNPQDVADVVRRIIETSPGQRPLRTVVGRILVDGVAEYNQDYERAQLRMAEGLKHPDQVVTWLNGVSTKEGIDV